MDMNTFLVSMALSVIFEAIKDTGKKAVLKPALLKLRDKINDLYKGDPGFHV